jgi:hypothetical protein
VENVDSLDPLMWWVANESKFPNVGSLAWQVLGILGSHIKTKQIFSIVGVSISW